MLKDVDVFKKSLFMVRRAGLEPARIAPYAPQAGMPAHKMGLHKPTEKIPRKETYAKLKQFQPLH